jgi:hypothetical protein
VPIHEFREEDLLQLKKLGETLAVFAITHMTSPIHRQLLVICKDTAGKEISLVYDWDENNRRYKRNTSANAPSFILVIPSGSRLTNFLLLGTQDRDTPGNYHWRVYEQLQNTKH